MHSSIRPRDRSRRALAVAALIALTPACGKSGSATAVRSSPPDTGDPQTRADGGADRAAADTSADEADVPGTPLAPDALEAGSADAADALVSRESLKGRSFVIEATLMSADGKPWPEFPIGRTLPGGIDHFSISIDSATPPNLTASRNGRDVQTRVLVPAGDGWRTDGSFTFISYNGGYYEQGLYSLSYRSFALYATLDGLRGTCEGGADGLYGDVGQRFDFRGTFAGSPSGPGDLCTCESPTTREGLPCSCPQGPSCRRRLCPAGVQHSLECRNGSWVDQVTTGITCEPPWGTRR